MRLKNKFWIDFIFCMMDCIKVDHLSLSLDCFSAHNILPTSISFGMCVFTDVLSTHKYQYMSEFVGCCICEHH